MSFIPSVGFDLLADTRPTDGKRTILAFSRPDSLSVGACVQRSQEDLQKQRQRCLWTCRRCVVWWLRCVTCALKHVCATAKRKSETIACRHRAVDCFDQVQVSQQRLCAHTRAAYLKASIYPTDVIVCARKPPCPQHPLLCIRFALWWSTPSRKSYPCPHHGIAHPLPSTTVPGRAMPYFLSQKCTARARLCLGNHLRMDRR